jgi:glucans biosynthesis protein C
MAEIRHEPADVAPSAELVRTAPDRLLCLDNLKVVLIAAIIAMHGIAGYAGSVEVWTYAEVQETTLHLAVELAFVVAFLPIGLILIALLFLVAGLLSVPSMQRKGPGRFAQDRLVRLGIPFTVYVLVVQPAVVYAMARPLGVLTGTFWEEYLGEHGSIDTGPLWFVGVLLIYSLGYAAWVRLHGRAAPGTAAPIGVRHLVLVVALVAPASFLIRVVYPYGSDAGVTDLNLWQWPACIAVFALGIATAGQGWQRAVPDGLRGACRGVTLAGMVAVAGLMVIAALGDRVEDVLGGANVLAAGFAVLDALLCTFGSVWMLSVAQRRLARPLPAGRALSRSAFAAFVLQTPILVGLALALRPLDLPAECKALLVAGGGVAASFALGWLVVTRVPGASRIL